MKIGYHRHVACLNVDVSGDADVLLRGAEFSAPLPTGPLPETLVTTKPSRDENILYFEDFDGTSCTFDLGKDCKLTADNGGRFGRGLLVTPTSGARQARSPFWQAARDRDDRILVQALRSSRCQQHQRKLSSAHTDDPDGLQTVGFSGQYMGDHVAFWFPERTVGQLGILGYLL